jgi:hypothetical protein
MNARNATIPTIPLMYLMGTLPKNIRTILVRKIKMLVEKLDNIIKKHVTPIKINITMAVTMLY